ncbi:MAG TPA: penicillin-binding protein 1B, partial [Gammaproteobacteria bacterium]|nr:penicillin-binding protein 1B [Gammaproteobacteria bacterium]
MSKPSARKPRSSFSSRKKRKHDSIKAPIKKSARKNTSTRRSQVKSRAGQRSTSFLKRYGRPLLVLAVLVLLIWLVYLDAIIRNQFEGKRWALPATVYARPLELYVGKKLSVQQLLREIKLSAYRPVLKARSVGTFSLHGNTFEVVTREFKYGDSFEDSRRLRLRIGHGKIVAVEALASGKSLDIVRLEPAVIGRIYPAHHEDRLLVRLKDVPAILVKGLIALEDRAFYQHHGLDPRAMARALWADVRAGRLVQGGSTLTQQLVKNFFLSNRRSLGRKANEAGMALLLEWHYSKAEILEAYLNEVYLGQDGKRAIHGFGLASHYYFDRPLAKLRLHEIATLIALVRGPSYY